MKYDDFFREYIYVDGNFEIVELTKKEILQKEFIRMFSKKHTSNSSDNTDINQEAMLNEEIDKDDMINSLLDRLVTQQEEISRLKESKVAAKQDLKKYKDDNTKLKQQRYNMLKELDVQTSTIKDMESEIKQLEKSVDEKNNTIRTLNSMIDKHNSTQDKKKIRKLTSANTQLKKNNRFLKEALREKTKQLDNYTMMREGTIESDVIKALNDKLAVYKAQKINLEAKYDALLLAFNKNSSSKDKKNKQLLKKKMVTNTLVSTVLDKQAVYEYGYITYNKSNEIVFRTVDKSMYKLTDDMPLAWVESKINLPAKVEIVENKAKIVEVYSVDENDSSEVNSTIIMPKRVKGNISGMKKLDIDFEIDLTGVKVLLIGQRFKKLYCQTLERKGAVVKWHESYSDNPSRASELAQWADVVITLTTHSPHSVINVIKTIDDYNDENVKYQFMEYDSAKRILARLNYVLENKKNAI